MINPIIQSIVSPMSFLFLSLSTFLYSLYFLYSVTVSHYLKYFSASVSCCPSLCGVGAALFRSASACSFLYIADDGD